MLQPRSSLRCWRTRYRCRRWSGSGLRREAPTDSRDSDVTHPGQVDLVALLRALVNEGIEFIVVGGGAAVLHGAPITTFDLDIVPRRDPGNASALLDLLVRQDVFIIEPMNRKLLPRQSDFLGQGQLNLSTRLGPLDVLCRLHDGRDYDELLAHSTTVSDGDIEVRVLDLPTLIEVKAGAGRAKDRLAVPILLALLERGGE